MAWEQIHSLLAALYLQERKLVRAEMGKLLMRLEAAQEDVARAERHAVAISRAMMAPQAEAEAQLLQLCNLKFWGQAAQPAATTAAAGASASLQQFATEGLPANLLLTKQQEACAGLGAQLQVCFMNTY
jgi:hypothetical protein